MGSFTSSHELLQKKLNRQIQERITKDGEAEQRILKLLLLGAGESGKTTLLKQMRLLHSDGFSSDEYMIYQRIVRLNVLHCIGALVLAMQQLELSYVDKTLEEESKKITGLLQFEWEHNEVTQELCNYLALIQTLWKDPGVQMCYERSNEFQLNDSTKYFLDEVVRICSAEYRPTEQDILRSRLKTTGIVEVLFEIKNTKFRVFDVGGQRSERRKWIHCFDHVNAILFLIAISEYDQVLQENSKTNRMKDATALFASITGCSYFLNTQMILFLNKMDIFAEKIMKNPITLCYPDYAGPPTFESCSKFVEANLLAVNLNPKRTIYRHFTCATDTRQINIILDMTLDTVLEHCMKKSGLYS